ncbi:hypothetical protein ACVXG7_24265 [Enterobacter hormaechei]
MGTKPINQSLHDCIAQLAQTRIGDAYRITEKQERYEQIDAIRDEVISTLLAEDESLDEGEIIEIFSGLEENCSCSCISG